MFEKRFYVEGLAHASYLFGADGQAAVVDPKRDVDDYIETAKQHGMQIVAVLETHPHADFASGHLELSQRTGAKIYISHRAAVKYNASASRDGDAIRVGELEVVVMETPGHSPDSLSFLVKEHGAPAAIYTGDTLFVGDVGRPDLRDADENPKTLASALYDSLQRLMTLPADTRILPAHGAGSLCGRKINSSPFTTVAHEKATNWAVQIGDRAEFVRTMISNLPARPKYFSTVVRLNLNGLPALNKLLPMRELTEEAIKTAAEQGAVVIDTRTAPFFGASHFPGSINIGLASPLFSTWVGFLIDQGKPIVLVVGAADNAQKAWLELVRIGYDTTIGFIEAEKLQQTQQLSQLSVCDLKSNLTKRADGVLLDVRTDGEWEASHIDGAIHVPLPELPSRLGKVPKDQPVAVMCGSGYRSSMAASLLKSAGVQQVQNVMGGMGAFMETKCPDWNSSDLIFKNEKP
jgi:hydroxyacylglutathione hydrolase